MLNQSFDLLNDLKSYSMKKIDFKIPLKNTYFDFVTGEIIQNACTGGNIFDFGMLTLEYANYSSQT